MPRTVIHWLIPLAFLMVMIFAVFSEKTPKTGPEEKPQHPITTEIDSSRILVRPFHTKDHQSALALDGGAIPAANGQVPSVVMGKNILRTVHLAWVHDWSQPECRSVFQNLQALYASEQGASLPALKIYLNPVFSDPAGEALHRAMMQVFFRSRIRENYLILAAELSNGTLPPDAGAIRKRVEEIDPNLMDDWDNPADWLNGDIEHTFSIAKIQQARNEAVLGPQSPAQLTSLLATLPPQAGRQELFDFLQQANNSQRAWLQQTADPAAAPPVSRQESGE